MHRLKDSFGSLMNSEGNMCRGWMPEGVQAKAGRDATESAPEASLAECFLAEFYGLHEFNARRISLLSDIQRVADEVGCREGRAVAEELVASILLTAPEREIPRAFRRCTPGEMPQIYRRQGLVEARVLLEEMVLKERSKPVAGRNPCPYYNLAYVYQLQSRRAPDHSERSRLLDGGLDLMEEAKMVLGRQADRLPAGWRSRETMLAVMENLCAVIRLSRCEVDAARAALDRALGYDSTLPEAHAMLGVLLVGKGEYDASILEMHKALQEFLARGQDVADVWFHLARAYYKKAALLPDADEGGGRLYAEAQACLAQALRIDPAFALAHLKLGLLLLRTDCERAVTHFRMAMEADISMYDAVTHAVCPRVCCTCSGVRLKMMLLDLLSHFKKRRLAVEHDLPAPN